MHLSESQEKLLRRFAAIIFEANTRYNVTGLTSLEEIYDRLILDSIAPFADCHVPRGTLFADVGSGAGIPGIPLAIYFPEIKGILIEANTKKAGLARHVIEALDVRNLEVFHGRVEDAARSEMRSGFNFIVSRAAGPLYWCIEVSAPLCAIHGVVAVYSNQTPDDLPEMVREHARRLGMAMLDRVSYHAYGVERGVLLFKKVEETDVRFPRRLPAIKRDLRRIHHNANEKEDEF